MLNVSFDGWFWNRGWCDDGRLGGHWISSICQFFSAEVELHFNYVRPLSPFDIVHFRNGSVCFWLEFHETRQTYCSRAEGSGWQRTQGRGFLYSCSCKSTVMHYEGRAEHRVILGDSQLIIFSDENTSFDLCREICGLGRAESKLHLLFPSFRRALGFDIAHLR